MSELLALVDAWKDRHGQPSDASIARAIGSAPQTISSWRKRGIRQLPEKATMRRLAEFLNVDYETVILAAARDAGYLDKAPTRPTPVPDPPTPGREVKGA